MSSYLQALLAVPFRYSAADRAFYKKGQLKWTWNKLWCPKKNPESLKNYLCQSCLGLSARWRIFQFWLTGALPQYYQKVFKYNIIVIFLFMDLTLYNEEIDVHLRNRCSSVSILFHTILELPISSPRVFSKLLWCCLHKKTPSIRYCWGHCPAHWSVLPYSCTLVCLFPAAVSPYTYIVNTMGKRVLIILSYTI